MKAYLQKKQGGITFLNTDERHKFSHLPDGTVIGIEATWGRSVQKHRLYFAVLEKAFDSLPETLSHFGTMDELRQALYLELGYTDKIKKLDGSIIERPKSVSFAECDGAEFDRHFESMKNILCKILQCTERELMEEV